MEKAIDHRLDKNDKRSNPLQPLKNIFKKVKKKVNHRHLQHTHSYLKSVKKPQTSKKWTEHICNY